MGLNYRVLALCFGRTSMQPRDFDKCPAVFDVILRLSACLYLIVCYQIRNEFVDVDATFGFNDLFLLAIKRSRIEILIDIAACLSGNEINRVAR
jgi:hypothetical protein